MDHFELAVTTFSAPPTSAQNIDGQRRVFRATGTSGTFYHRVVQPPGGKTPPIRRPITKKTNKEVAPYANTDLKKDLERLIEAYSASQTSAQRKCASRLENWLNNAQSLGLCPAPIPPNSLSLRDRNC
jgi:hypothetical protein